MDFALDDEKRMFRQEMKEFATNELEPFAAKWDREQQFPSENVRKLAERGLFGLTIPREYGGLGADTVHYIIALEEIGRACASTSSIWGSHLGLACNVLMRHGTEEQRRKYLVPLAKGERIGAFALTEPEAGSDPASMTTTAVRRGDFYVINGTKCFVTNGDLADPVIIFATVDRSLGYRGVTSFILPKDTPGFSIGRKEDKMGQRGAQQAELILEDCRLPQANMLGGEKHGFSVALDTVDRGRISTAAQSVGIARAALEACIQYSKQRHQFGQPISSFEAIQWMLADMATGIEAARMLTYEVARMNDLGMSITKVAAMAKLFASQVAVMATSNGIRIHGGYGYTKQYAVERYFRDSRATEIYEGTNEVQHLVIARGVLGA